METLKKIFKFSLVVLIVLTIFVWDKLFLNIFSNKASADVPPSDVPPSGDCGNCETCAESGSCSGDS